MLRAILIVLCMMCCWVANAQQHNQQQIQKLNQLYSYLRSNYVDEVDLEPLVEEAIRATISELDPHSSYLTQEEMANMRSHIRGAFAGVGIRYIQHNDTIVVRSTIPHSPAASADIRPNDRITAVEGRSIIGITTDSLATLLRGDVNTKVEIAITRRGEPNTLRIRLQRDIIENNAISSAFRIGDIGYIAVSHFSKPVAAEFLAAYRGLGDMKSLIVDLRDNGGGAISSAIDLTGLFLKRGDVILSTEGRSYNAVYDKKRDGALCDIPLVVLINENSASASEIFAGAIQDHDRGVIVGRRSYGKGLIQRVVEFKDKSGLCITIARYKTPSGRIIQRPYCMGEAEEYRSDSMRYKEPDRSSLDTLPRFKTLNSERVVYGGGGIMPDIYIQADSLRHDRPITQHDVEHAVVALYDHMSAEKLKMLYPTPEEYAECFTLDVELSAEALAIIKAQIAEEIYGAGAYYHIYGRNHDEALRRATEIASSTKEMQRILRGDK